MYSEYVIIAEDSLRELGRQLQLPLLQHFSEFGTRTKPRILRFGHSATGLQ